ncbi:hypothetical protein [Streptosporangium carneum]|uniref:Uncharacterized protein n=1 Tax=Streptosporangium carneum TaxID=47481 RepID=A0A9W6ICI5_9ACTN|nr:hypothetical protein [Streptosporangium carneum]GLK15179.1 hypothetical protein GCM10017600_85920 [Streptosporangium carneum]
MSSNVSRLYQAVLRDKTAPIAPRLRRTFGEWLAAKGLPAPEPGRASQEFESDGARVRVERAGDCGRYIVEEEHGDGLLRTRVAYAEWVGGPSGWVVVTVEEDGETCAGQAPGFVQAYLRTARITDGAVHLTDTADEIDEDDVHRLISALSERRRRVPVAVVSVDPQDPQAARTRADYLAGMTAGAGVVVRFADMRAQRRFNEAMGAELGVFGGGIRTYLAPFDPGNESYPYRHRPMGGGMIRKQGRQALDLAADGIVGETARRAFPDDVQRAYRVVSRVLVGKAGSGDLAEAMTPTPAPPAGSEREGLRRWMMAMTARPETTAVGAEQPAAAPEAAQEPSAPEPDPAAQRPPLPTPSDASPGMALDMGELAQTVAGVVARELRGELDAALGLAASSAEGGPGSGNGEILRQMRTLSAHVEGLRDLVVVRQHGDQLLAEAEDESDRLAGEMDRLHAEHEILQQEYAEAVAGARKLQERVRWLEARLARAGQPAFGLTSKEPVFEPTSLMDALNMARETLAHVEIGDTDTEAARLDLTYPTLARAWASKTWDALRALDAFARARSSGEFAGGFFDWCRSPARLTIPAGMVAMSESRTVNTNGKYSMRRTFAVPEEVHPSGKVMMEAHIKIRKGGCPAPRIHFHDDSGGCTGKIWIGHVGDHLPNTHTN